MILNFESNHVLKVTYFSVKVLKKKKKKNTIFSTKSMYEIVMFKFH
jgi:hypothetical protein